MDGERVTEILEAIGAENIVDYGKNIQCSCFLARWRPGHSNHSDHSGSMGISVSSDQRSLMNCFSCGYRGTLLRAVRELGRCSGVDHSELISRIKKIEEKSPTEVADSIHPYAYVSTEEVVPVIGECVPRILFSSGGEDYLASRGFDRDTIREWGCRYDSAFRRAVIPIRRSKAVSVGCGSSRLVGAVGRTTVGYEVKYFNYFKFRRGGVLFGEDHILQGSRGVVVEGLLDTIAVWQELRNVGLLDQYSVVGILGSHASSEQVSKLVRFFNEVILFLDNDQAGWTGQVQISRDLGKRVFLRSVNYPGLQGEDPMVLIRRNVDIVSLIKTAHLIVV